MMKFQLATLVVVALLPFTPVQAQGYGDQPPPGDYWRSCRNVNLDGYGPNATVSATCRDERGSPRYTTLAFASCNGWVANRDGRLECARRGYYQDRERPNFAMGMITLYPGPGFQGPGYAVNRDVTNLPKQYNDRTMSLRVRGGSWQVCADSDFEGRCQVIDRDVANLNDLGLGEAVSSLRQIR
ncbi:MAG: hypothetical protein CGW95_11070 [Phenylobacterium zucineum]|nr:MAG: hypothetical protein CGW95_11070 [Phenylobacterium zucineum]